MNIEPIAYIKTDFDEKFGIPRQSGNVKQLKGQIVFTKEFKNPDSVRGIKEYSHIWLLFDFSKNHRDFWSPTVRPPRLGGNTKKGVFATRSPFRPNNLGLSCVKLESVEIDENLCPVLNVSGVDLLNGTPIFDIKPYIPYCDSKPFAKGSFGQKNKRHRVKVCFKKADLKDFPKEKIKTLINCLKQDPRPSYHDDERIYKMKFSGYDISFCYKNKKINVLNAEKTE